MARWLGIDFSDGAVRIALVHSTLRRTTVEALRQASLTEHESPEAALRSAITGLRSDAACVGLSGRRGFLRRIDLPKAAQRELENVLGFEVEATLPCELDDAVMDHRRLRRVAGVDTKQTIPVLAAVAFTNEVRDRIALVQQATGQEPQRVGLGGLPLANLSQLAAELNTPGATALLDLGLDHADFVVMRQGEPHFARSLARGVGELPMGAVRLANELRQTLGAWRAQGGEPLERLYVCGTGSATPGLDAYLATELNVEVRGLPALGLTAPSGVAPEALPLFTKAIALALGLSRRATDLNLRRGPLEAQHSYRFVQDKTPLLAGLITALAVSFGFSVFAQLKALDSEQAVLQDQLEAATGAMLGEKIRDPKVARELFDKTLAGKTDDPMPRMDAFGVMVELSERVPKEVTHDVSEFDFNRGAVVIRGIVPTIDEAQIVSNKMSEHPCFQDVKISRTTKVGKEDKQKYVLEFEAKCGVEPDKDSKGKQPADSTPPKGGKR